MEPFTNRRESFRLDDTLDLRIRILDKQSVNAIVADFDTFRMRYCMKSHAQSQMDMNQPRLMKIRNKYPDVAFYLEYLESRLIELTEQVEKLSLLDTDENVLNIVSEGNISAVGARFSTSEEFTTGQILEISMILSTSTIQVVMIGEVVRVDSLPKGRSAVSVTYKHIHSEDEEAIVRHLVKLQQLQLRASRSDS